MAWEQRRGRKYYYRARRVDSRVVKEYLGVGAVAEAAASADAALKQERLDGTQRRRHAEASLDELKQQFEKYWKATERLASLALIACRYHRRRGEWRLKRGSRSCPKGA